SGAALLYLDSNPRSELATRMAGLGLAATGAVLLALVWLAGAVRQAANRIRPASQPQLWVVRGAFAWLIFGGGFLLYMGLCGFFDSQVPAQSDFDVVRHGLGVGVITMLIAGMSMMILPEFAGERQGPNRQPQLAYGLLVLLNAATL